MNASPDTRPDTDPFTQRFEPDREVRIAAVLYGGVSLAIYIHGVTQELLRAVRATAPATAEPGCTKPLLSGTQLESTESIYRELSRRAGSAAPFAPELSSETHGRMCTRFIVDVLAGTSAGGINGIFLAKALANMRQLNGLRNLWIKEGDVDLLLADKRSGDDLPKTIRQLRPPEAVLNTTRMYYRLLEAFEGMDPSESGPLPPSALVDELKLFVTATDIRGWVVPIALWDRAVFERRHRNVFEFIYATKYASGEARNDFRTDNNGLLAFAARCTSSFPAAFEPMMLQDLARIPPWNREPKRLEADIEKWRGFFKEYLRSPRSGPRGQPTEAVIAERALADGGYLDNKPFSYATESLRTRRADRRTARKLFYVEPAPERPEFEVTPSGRPDLFENVGAATITLPRAETIREDLERVFERNRVIDRTAQVMDDVDADLAQAPLRKPPTDRPYEETGLNDMLGIYGAAYGTYHRVKVAQLTWEIAELFVRLGGLDESSGLVVAIRHLIVAWMDERYEPNVNPLAPEETRKLTQNRLLRDYDLGYRVRRLQFLQERLDDVLAMIGRSERRTTASPESRPDPRDVARLQATFGAVNVPVEGWLEAPSRETLRSVVLAIKAKLAMIQVELRLRGRRLRSHSRRKGEAENPVARTLEAAHFGVQELRWILETPLEDERRARAKQVLGAPMPRAEAVDATMQELATQLKAICIAASEAVEALFKSPIGIDSIVAAETSGRLFTRVQMDSTLKHGLAGLYARFESFDSTIFPLQWGTSAATSQRVDVLRISPQDTDLLPEFSADGSRRLHKLAGTRIGNFGAFFEESWRRSDILWGRLDGAERIIRSVLVARSEPEEQVVKDVILRAHAEIVADELEGLSDPEARRVMYQCVLRTTSGRSAPEVLDELVGKLLPEIKKVDARLGLRCANQLEPAALREAYLENFEAERRLSPEHGLKVLGRASTILGRVLDGLSDKYGPFSKKAGWGLLWFGRTIVGVIEVLIPRSVAEILFRYWLNLFYLIAGVGLLTGLLINRRDVRLLSAELLLVVLAVDLTSKVLRGALRRRAWTRSVLGLLLVAIVTIGLWTVLQVAQDLQPWLERQLTTVRDWFGR